MKERANWTYIFKNKYEGKKANWKWVRLFHLNVRPRDVPPPEDGTTQTFPNSPTPVDQVLEYMSLWGAFSLRRSHSTPQLSQSHGM